MNIEKEILEGNKLQFYSKILKELKKCENKNHEFVNMLDKHGINIVNYDDGILTLLLHTIRYNLNDMYDNIDWWLYEDVDKIIYYNDESGVKKELNVEEPEDLIKYLLFGIEDAKQTE